MKAVQIDKYSKEIEVKIRNIAEPKIGENDVLIQVKVAAVNPLEILNITGAVKLIQNYKMPLILGNELSGVIFKIGSNVKKFNIGDRVYARLPINRIGAFAEHVAVDSSSVAKMPEGYDFDTSAAILLTALTAYQAITEELQAKPREVVLITGGSGSFGQLAVPIAKELKLKVIVTGNSYAKNSTLSLGADKYIDYHKENYWEELSDIDYVIDTLGNEEIERELSVMKKGGKLVSLRAMPNKTFAEHNNIKGIKKILFTLAGKKLDKLSAKYGVSYSFLFVRADGEQLQKITDIVIKNNIKPTIHSQKFYIDQAQEAIKLVASGKAVGKVLIEF